MTDITAGEVALRLADLLTFAAGDTLVAWMVDENGDEAPVKDKRVIPGGVDDIGPSPVRLELTPVGLAILVGTREEGDNKIRAQAQLRGREALNLELRGPDFMWAFSLRGPEGRGRSTRHEVDFAVHFDLRVVDADTIVRTDTRPPNP